MQHELRFGLVAHSKIGRRADELEAIGHRKSLAVSGRRLLLMSMMAFDSVPKDIYDDITEEFTTTADTITTVVNTSAVSEAETEEQHKDLDSGPQSSYLSMAAGLYLM